MAYDNNYLMQFEVAGGKITGVKEALDCYQIEAWFKSREEEAAAKGV